MPKRLASPDDYKAIAVELLSRLKQRPILIGGWHGGIKTDRLRSAIVIEDDARTIDINISMESDDEIAKKSLELEAVINDLCRLDPHNGKWSSIQSHVRYAK